MSQNPTSDLERMGLLIPPVEKTFIGHLQQNHLGATILSNLQVSARAMGVN